MQNLLIFAQAAAQSAAQTQVAAQDAGAQASQTASQGGGSSMLLFLLLMFAAMYFLMIAPQRKKQKQHQKMIGELKHGDKIVTIGGMCGTIVGVKDKTFIVKVADGTKVEYLKSAIQDIFADNSELSDQSDEAKR